MYLKTLSLNNFRNFTAINSDFSSNFNVLYGENGSGKTNFLEAIYYLSRGRSFRCHLSPRLIKHDCDKFTLHGKLEQNANQVTVGVERLLNSEQQSHISGEKTRSRAELARLLPLQFFNQESFCLVTGSPDARRRFLDWGVFHVKQAPFSLWKNFTRALQQRNAALKSKLGQAELQFWNKELAKTGLEIHQLRQEYFAQVLPLIEQFLRLLLPDFSITANYYAGWDLERNLTDILGANLERDLQLGFTQAGPHRADLKWRIGKTPAADILSRGQQKLFLLGLYLAQSALFKQTRQENCLLLIDDLTAELDQTKQVLAMQTLTQLETQLFITGIDTRDLVANLTQQGVRNIKMFHVKHGEIRENSV